MATGDNATLLQTNKTNWEARAGAPANRRPRDYLEGTNGSAQFSGNASTTAFSIPHGLVNDAGNGITPTFFDVTGIDAVSNAAKTLTATTANIVVTFAAAPASGTNNINLKWVALR
jgi:hypothetical protein